MHHFTRFFCGTTLALGIASHSLAEPIAEALLVPAPKIDSGLGELSHASQWHGVPWLHAMPAEKIDSGLGELPHASQWQGVPWLYALPEEKIDSGLGSLPPASQWRDAWLYASPADGGSGGTAVYVAGQSSGSR